MRILGIETSCDETAAAVIEASSPDGPVHLLSHVVATSLSLHSQTGGIIPEIAAREQIKYIIPVIQQAVEKSQSKSDQRPKTKDQIDAIAVTYGPGLIGSLLVGVETAKTLAYVWNKPLIPVNHLYGHIYANWLTTSDQQPKTVRFPALALIVSGGHTDLVLMKSHDDITWLGGTRDDAAGECFDKCARLLGYPYPGGPKISTLASKGDPKAFQFPRPMIGSHDFDFSFSGLKTAFLNTTKEHFPILRTSDTRIGWQQVMLEERLQEKDKQTLYDLCASLQEAIVDVIVKKTINAAKEFSVKSILLGGGVASNDTLQAELRKKTNDQRLKTEIFVPQKSLCTDNGAMIAAAGFFHQKTLPWQSLSANPELYFD